jgi:perosamine synthetase
VKIPNWPNPRSIKFSLASPDLSDLEKLNVNEALDSSLIGSLSPFVQKAEDTLTEFYNRPVIVVSNGSVALTLALRVLDIKPGSFILTSALTYAATASSIVNAGCIPIFCDVENDSWQISIDSLNRMYTSNCSAIVVPHIYGVSADMDKILDFASKKQIKVIEDCAEIFLGEYKGELVGTLGNVGTLSFFPNKLLTAGEGGGVINSDAESFSRAKLLRGQGMDPSKRYYFLEPGFNFRMSGLQAAVLCGQLSRFGYLWDGRETCEKNYSTQLEGFIVPPTAGYEFVRSPWLFTGRLHRKSKASPVEIASKLSLFGIETRPVFYPLPDMPAFQKYPSDSLSNSRDISFNSISLPTGMHIDMDTQATICDQLKEIISW